MFRQLYSDLPEFDQDFMNGFESFDNKRFDEAIEHFSSGIKIAGRKSASFNKYLAFIALCQVLTKDCSALNTLRELANQDCYDGDIFCNLAIAEFVSKHRRRAFSAIDKGLNIGSDHDGLAILYEMFDTRRAPTLPFLTRDNPLNIALGKVSYRLKNNSFRSCDEYLSSYIS